MSSPRHAALALALLAAWAAPAAAQQPEQDPAYQVVTDAQLAAMSPAPADGQRLSVNYGKFHKQFNEYLKLLNAPQLTERLVVRDPRLRALLNGGKDSSDPPRPVRLRGNLQVMGTAQRAGQGFVLVVTRVVALESDLEHVRRLWGALQPKDAKGRESLRAYAQGRLARFYQDAAADPDERKELMSIVKQLEDEVRAIELEGLPPLPAGAETHIDYGRRYRALAILSGVAEHPEVPAELRARAEQALQQDLRARRHLGRWYRYEEFKDLVGFASLGGDRWATRDRVEFVQTAEAERRRLLASQEPIAVLPAALLAQSKDVVRGMNKDMALSVLQAYPARVDRFREPLAASSTTVVTFEQWVMESGQRIYFINGLVFARVE